MQKYLFEKEVINSSTIGTISEPPTSSYEVWFAPAIAHSYERHDSLLWNLITEEICVKWYQEANPSSILSNKNRTETQDQVIIYSTYEKTEQEKLNVESNGWFNPLEFASLPQESSKPTHVNMPNGCNLN